MSKKRLPGLRLRNGIWHIDKQLKGVGRIYGSTGTSDVAEASSILATKILEARQTVMFGKAPELKFKEASERYLRDYCPAKSQERAQYAFGHVMPHIGHLRLEQIHDGSILGFKKHRAEQGAAAGTINKELMFVRRVLNLAARVWRDDVFGRPYLSSAPLLAAVKGPAKQPYPLSWDEQEVFFDTLPVHSRRMALFDVNTGLRESAVCALRWEWEVSLPDLNTSVFVCPGWLNDKNNDTEYLVVLNRVARQVIEEVRGEHSEYVFTYEGLPMVRMHNSSWKRAWRTAGLPVNGSIRRGPHNLRHTFGYRLRAAGVSAEDRMDLLWHTNRNNMARHYAVPDVVRLISASEKVCETRGDSVLRVVSPAKSRHTQPLR